MAKRNAIDGLLDRFERLVADKGPDVGEVLVVQMKRHLAAIAGNGHAGQPVTPTGGAKRGSKPKGPSDQTQAMGQEKFSTTIDPHPGTAQE